MTEPILVTTKEMVSTIILNRPEKRNAMNGEMMKLLLDTLNQLKQDESSRILLFRGNGDHFCAGADIEWMKRIAKYSFHENQQDAKLLADLMYQLYVYPKPTIALVQGAALGGGLGLLAACDIAIATSNANFGFPEVKLGIAASNISPYVLAAIGERAARYYFLTGEYFDANEAKRIGLIHRITEENTLLETGLSLCKTILSNSPQALTAAKQLILDVAKEKITTELSQKTADHLASLRHSDEAQEGLHAFLEKRKPLWKW